MTSTVMIPPYSQDGDGKLVWKNVHGGMMCLLLRAAGTRTPRYLTGLNLGEEMGAASSHELKQRLSRRPASELMAGAIHSLAAPGSAISRGIIRRGARHARDHGLSLLESHRA